MWASHPHSLNFASVKSALSLSWGEPTWLGAEDICSSHEPRSAGSSAASKDFSDSSSAAEEAALNPERDPLWAHALVPSMPMTATNAPPSRNDFMGPENPFATPTASALGSG